MMRSNKIVEVISGFLAPESNHSIAELGGRIQVSSDTPLVIEISLSYPVAKFDEWKVRLQSYLVNQFGLEELPTINVTVKIKPRIFTFSGKRHQRISNVIAVGSGKGGVGKSTVSLNLALALASQGARVGLLDSDVYGPNIPHLLGHIAPHESKKETELDPLKLKGIEVMSLGQFIARRDPIVWRGPMVGKVVEQLFYETRWSDLDYLIVDLPPGTGDVQITFGKKIPLTASIMVTTPQTVACMDAQKALTMFERMQVPVLGFVNNMSSYLCENCHHKQKIFSGLDVEELATTLGVPHLCDLPLAQSIAHLNEKGGSIFEASEMYDLASIFTRLALTVGEKLCLMKKDYSLMMPDVEVQNH